MTKPYQIGAIILAAGLSRRAGPKNKLLGRVDGLPIIQRVVESIMLTKAYPLIVVTGHESGRIQSALKTLPVEFTHNPDFSDGMGSSIARGVSALPEGVDGVLICLGDMPHIQADTLKSLMRAFDPEGGVDICLPVQNGKRGNPVLFGRHHFSALREIEGDQGGRNIIQSQPGRVVEVQVMDSGIFVDYDTGVT